MGINEERAPRPHAQRRRRSARAAGRRRGPLAASAAALALALCLLAAVGVAAAVGSAGEEGPLRSADSSTVGIFVENGMTPDEMLEAGLQGNDSNLGIYVTGVVAHDLVVRFYSQGAPARPDVTVSYGGTVRQPVDPVWNWDLAPEGLDPDTPVRFEGWCVEDSPGSLAPGTAYDFAAPVTQDLVLVAAWGLGRPVDVRLHACGGELAGADGEGVLVVQRYPGSPYRSLPTPTMAGYGFAGWSSVERDPGLEHLVDASGVVPEGGADLYAQWEANTFWVRYVSNPDMMGGGAQLDDKAVVYGSGAQAIGWEDAASEDGGFYAPTGKVFDGWDVKPDGSDGSGRRFWAGDDVSRITEAVEHVPLYAQWADDESLKGPFTVTFDFGYDGRTETRVVENRGDKVEDATGELAAPKRPGYQFGGWVTDAGEKWSLELPVLGPLTVHATWGLRLDVTVPVSVAFAVDAASGTVTAPDADRYALRSRTVREVEVDSLALESRQVELEAFFAPEGGAPWADALAETELSLAPEGGSGVSLPFAGEEEAGLWTHERPIEATERSAWTLAAFDYDAMGAPFEGDAWQGADPSEQLPIALDLRISDRLEVLTGQAGAVPITHLKVTVSAAL